MGGRIIRRKREDGAGRMFDGANEMGRSASCARREGLWSRSLSWSGSYEPSPAKVQDCQRAASRCNTRISKTTNLRDRQLEECLERILAPFHDAASGVCRWYSPA